MPTFVHRSVVHVSVIQLFRWHERPEALLDLMPSRRWVRVVQRSGGLRNGGTVTFSIGVGPFRLQWEAQHFGYIAGRQFCDEQVRGPFAMWRHTHRLEPIGADQTLYEDRVEYAIRGGRVLNRVAGPLLRRLLSAGFARRHQIVRDAFGQRTQRARGSARVVGARA
jgi:ligand-binding SRPBCC domain-containing protein